MAQYKYNFSVPEEEEKEVEKKTRGQFEYDFSADSSSPKTAQLEEVIDEANTETFPEMPEGFNKGEYSSNPDLDRKVAERVWKQKAITDSLKSGEVSDPVAGFQKVGQMAGVGLDIAGQEVVDTTVGLAGLASSLYKAAVPEAIKDYVTKEGESIGAGIYQLQHAANVDEFVKSNAKKLGDWWDGLDKQTRRTLESTGLIASIIPVRQTAKGASELMGMVTKPARGKLVTSLAKEKLDEATEFVRPYLSGGYERDVLKRTLGGKYTPNAKEKAMGEAVANLEGYTVRGNPIKNKDVILDAIKAKTAKLDSDVAKYGSNVDSTQLDKIGDAVVKLTKDNADFVGVNEKVPMLRIMKVRELLKNEAAKSGGKLTTKGVLNVRREWDRIIKERTPAAFTDKAKEFNPILNTDKVIREQLNDIIDSTTKVDLKRNRSELSNLISASENVVGKLQRGHEHIIKDALNTIGGTARGLWSLKTLGKLAAGASATAVDPRIAGGILAAVGVSYVGKKITMSRPVRQALLGIVAGLDEAGKITKSASELVKIKAQKTAISKILANTVIQEASKEEEND